MLRLIRNEYAKIFLKKSTYIIIGVCLLITVGMSALVQFATNTLEEFFYEDMSLEEELSYYPENSEYIYDRINHKVYSTYIDMGYEYYMDIPAWVYEAVDTAMYEHYAYVLISQDKNVEQAEIEMGMYLADVDLEYEKALGESMFNAITAKDYKEFFELCMADYEKKPDELGPYEKGRYEYYKYMVEKDVNPEEDEQMVEVINVYVSAKAQYDSYLESKEQGHNVSEYDMQTAKKTYEIYKHILDNDLDAYMIEPLDEMGTKTSTNKFITAIVNSGMVGSMAGIFVMIVAAGIIANEFASGTIKFLLINPVKRAKIFWSKYITCVTLLVATLVSFFAIYFMVCIVMCGIKGVGGVYLSYVDDAVRVQPIMMYAVEQYALAGVSILVSVTIAFMISSLMRSNAVAIAVSVAIEFAGATVILFLSAMGHDWGRYLIFANTDLVSISSGASLFPGHTLTFALVTIAVYMVIFLLTAYDAFTKKEV